jgi:hypothetical protein
MLNTTTFGTSTYSQTDIDIINKFIARAWTIQPHEKMVQEITWAETLLSEGETALDVAIEMACVFGYMADCDALMDQRDALAA